jgi:hypothetical protein
VTGDTGGGGGIQNGAVDVVQRRPVGGIVAGDDEVKSPNTGRGSGM